MTKTYLEHRIEEIKRELSALGPIHPGSVSEQYNICGTPGCHCKDPKDPQKHGPYYQLSYGWRGRSSTLFVRADQVGAAREKVANYKRMQELVKEWVDLAMEVERRERAAQKHRDRSQYPPAGRGDIAVSGGEPARGSQLAGAADSSAVAHAGAVAAFAVRPAAGKVE